MNHVAGSLNLDPGTKNEFIFVKLWASGQVSVKSSFFLLSTVTQTVLDSAWYCYQMNLHSLIYQIKVVEKNILRIVQERFLQAVV